MKISQKKVCMYKYTWMHRLNYFIINLPLRIKIIAIVICSLLILFVGSISSLRFLHKQYDLLLYKCYQAILEESVDNLSSVLKNTQSYVDTMSVDNSIQECLSQVKDKDKLSAGNVRQLKKNLQNFLISDVNKSLYDLEVYTSKGIFYNNSYNWDNCNDYDSNDKFSDMELKTIVEIASDNKGHWLTQYSNTYGLVIVKNVRRVVPMRLDSLGVLIGFVDLDKLVQNYSAQTQQESSYFSLMDNGDNVFYTYNTFKQKIDFSSLIPTDTRYTVVNQNGMRYFVIRGTIDRYGWSYMYGIPYDSIYNTIQNQFFKVITILVLSIIFAFAVSTLLLRQILRDVNKLIKMISNVSRADFADVKINTEDMRRRDEIGVLIKKFNQMSCEIDELIRNNYESQLLVQETRLQALEMQINPHFLYNTLGAVRCCALLGNTKDVCQIVDSLGNILHLVMGSYNNEITMSQELEIVNDYIAIQRLRFSGKLSFVSNIDPNCHNVKIPKLIILPLVENAVVHGVENSIDTCYIRLNVQIHEGSVHICVKNTGTRFADNFLCKLRNNQIKPTHHGIGILNIDSRLRIYFNTSYSIDFYNEADCAVVNMMIPYCFINK